MITAALSLAFLATLIYLHAFFKFYSIVRSEQPAWVERRGSLSFLSDGLPQALDPNVGAAVIRTACSSRIQRLRSPNARSFARQIRICLPLGVMLYLSVLAVQLLGAV